MHFEVVGTKQYERDVKKAKKRGLPLDKLIDIVEMLEQGIPLPAKNRDHLLTGDFAGYRECHISPDWLLIYKKDVTIRLITLNRTGTHADLFK